jgi:hypothetical protein
MDAIEPINKSKSHLWIGSRGKITVLDMNTQKIIGECNMARPGTIELMVVYAGDIFFIGDGQYSESYVLYHMRKPAF